MFDFTKLKKIQSARPPYVWSRVPEPTLPPSYPKRANFSLISLQSSADSLHEVVNSSREGETTRRGGGGGGGMRAHAKARMFTAILSLSSAILSNM